MNNRTNAFRSMLCILSLSLSSLTANAVVFDDNSSTNNNSGNNNSGDLQLADSQPFSGRIIVKYQASFSQQNLSSASDSDIASIASAAAGEKISYVREMAMGAHVMTFTKKMTNTEANDAILKMRQNPNIEYAHEDKMLQIMATPNDPQYSDQWHYFEASGGLNLPQAWDTSTGSGAVVAVIDTGYRPHTDLVGNILPGYDMISDRNIAADGNGRDSDARDVGDAVVADQCGPGSRASNSSWHGTHVAGTVAAVSNNNVGVAGVAYNAKIVPIRALGKCGGFTSDIADSMIWGAGGSVPGVPNNANPADVLNLSLGGGGSCDATSQAAINQAVSLGATVVVAAGNSSTNASSATPANCNNVVSVAATGRTGGRASYSNFGNVVDLAAPGGDINSGGTTAGVLSTLNTGRDGPAADSYAYYQGTSMATPHVAGAAALLYSIDSSISPANVESILKSTARNFPATCNGCGTGIVDAKAAVDAVAGTGGPGTNDGELENGQAVGGLAGATGSQAFFSVDVPAGASNLSIRISGGSGDADLYVRFGANPTTTSYDCRPFRNGNTESCTFANPQAGTYNIMLRGYSAFSGVSVVASFNTGGSSPATGNDTISESNLSATRGNWLNYEIDVPAGRSLLSVAISGGSGDADVYVRRGSNPTTSTYDCRPYRTGNSETCSISNPAAGKWFVRVRAFSNFSGVRLQASSQ